MTEIESNGINMRVNSTAAEWVSTTRADLDILMERYSSDIEPSGMVVDKKATDHVSSRLKSILAMDSLENAKSVISEYLSDGTMSGVFATLLQMGFMEREVSKLKGTTMVSALSDIDTDESRAMIRLLRELSEAEVPSFSSSGGSCRQVLAMLDFAVDMAEKNMEILEVIYQNALTLLLP